MSEMMESNKGWFIHSYPIRDRLYLVYILTPTKLLKAFYRLPKMKSHTAKPQPFFPYWVTWQERKGNINIHSLELSAPPLSLNGVQLFMGLYLNELIFHLCRQGETFPGFYDLYEQLLYAEGCDERLLRQFEWQLLADCGYAIDFSRTCDNQRIEPLSYYEFLVDQGFVVSSSGILGRHLLAIDQNDWQHAETSIIFKKLLRMMLDNVLAGRSLHSRQLLKDFMQMQS